MCRWLDVVSVYMLTPGSRYVVDVDGIPVAIFNLDGEFFAIEDACPHDGGAPSKGDLVGEEIVCPLSGDRFSIRTGEEVGAPAYAKLGTFPVRVSQGKVQIEIDVGD